MLNPSDIATLEKAASYYDSIAGGYEELHGEEQRNKLNAVKRHLTISEGELALDIGCGTGASSELGCSVVGIDPSQALLMKAAGRKIMAVRGFAEMLPFRSAAFDLVISLTAAQNFFCMERAFAEMVRVGREKWAVSITRKSKKAGNFRVLAGKAFGGMSIKEIDVSGDLLFIIEKKIR